MILTVCMSPCTDITIELDSFNLGRTNIVKSKKLSFGGKALNVAIGVARLGEKAHVAGLMYNDNGHLFENALYKESVGYTFAWNPGRARENYKFIDSRAMLTEVNDVGGEIEDGKADEIVDLVRSLSTKSKVTVLSGGLPKGLKPEYYGRLAQAVHKDSMKVVDATGQRIFSALNTSVDLVKPNLEELENALGRSLEDRADMLAGCYELLDRGAKRVLLSLGKQGAIITDGTDNYFCKSINVAMNSTVGAGDGMVAAAAITLKNGGSTSEILRAGVAAGTATVMSVGNVSFTKEKYEEVYASLRVEKI